MVPWFTLRRPATDPPHLGRRGHDFPVMRIELHEIMPDVLPLLGQCALANLQQFQFLASVSARATSIQAQQVVANAAARALAKNQEIVAEIRHLDGAPDELLSHYVPEWTALMSVLERPNWRESLLSAIITGGLLDDFFLALAGNLAQDMRSRVVPIVASETGRDALLELLQSELAADSSCASVMALWGRRLVGDTLLVARSVLHLSGNPRSDEKDTLPIFTELIAAHTRRMDALGLTA